MYIKYMQSIDLLNLFGDDYHRTSILVQVYFAFFKKVEHPTLTKQSHVAPYEDRPASSLQNQDTGQRDSMYSNASPFSFSDAKID